MGEVKKQILKKKIVNAIQMLNHVNYSGNCKNRFKLKVKYLKIVIIINF